jgi:hypothetical protein
MKRLIFHLMQVQQKLFSTMNLVIEKLFVFLSRIELQMNQLVIMLIYGHFV